MFRNMDQYQEKIHEVLEQMNKELTSEEFTTAEDSHKMKVKTAINALQGIADYMSAGVVERKVAKEYESERIGAKT